jgi:hypothetical protein
VKWRNNVMVLNTMCVVVAGLSAANYKVFIKFQNDIHIIWEDGIRWALMIAQSIWTL